MAKKTQTQLLEELIELMTPVANLAKYQIAEINQASYNQQLLAKAQQEAAEAAKKEEE